MKAGVRGFCLTDQTFFKTKNPITTEMLAALYTRSFQELGALLKKFDPGKGVADECSTFWLFWKKSVELERKYFFTLDYFAFCVWASGSRLSVAAQQMRRSFRYW